jgi:IS30 family transposase
MKNKAKKFSQLSKSERNEIAILLNKGYEQKDIAEVLKRAPSTICDEIKRNFAQIRHDSCLPKNALKLSYGKGLS